MTDRSYQRLGRRKGRPLKSGRKDALARLPEYTLRLPADESSPIDLSTLFQQSLETPLWLEVGFGNGEHLVQQAARHPGINFIGCEPFTNGLSACLKDMLELGLENIRFWPNDAHALLPRLPDQCAERFYLLFSDPWPKARHHKRRFIQPHTVATLARIMNPNGLIIIATDHADLAEWTREQFTTSDSLMLSSTEKPDDWIPTRYQEKALAGERTHYLLYRPTQP